MNILISAIICTHNRAEYLRKALVSLENQTLGHDLFEIIVIDNASTDNTRQLIAELSSNPLIQYTYEPVIGLSRARNVGWSKARGKYVAYLDDDAIACQGWLAKIIEVFETYEPRPGCVGGKVEGIWEKEKPEWLYNGLLGHFAIINWSDVPIIINQEQFLPGCNIAFQKELIEKVGGFCEELGRQGEILLEGEETHLRLKLESLGFTSVYHPDIMVHHHIQASRINKSWFRRMMYWTGISDAVMLIQDNRPSMATRLHLSISKVGWALPRLFLMFFSTSSASSFRRQCQVFWAMGYISKLWQYQKELR